MRIPELLLVAEDTAVELKNLLKAAAAEKGGRFFTANAAGAIHQHLAIFQMLELRQIFRQFAEMLDLASQRALKFPGIAFVAIAHIHHHRIGLFLEQTLPLRRRQMVIPSGTSSCPALSVTISGRTLTTSLGNVRASPGLTFTSRSANLSSARKAAR